MKDDAHIQRMLAKGYNFEVKHVLVKARELSASNNWTLAIAIFVLIAIGITIGMVMIQVLNIQTQEDLQNISDTQAAVSSLLTNIIFAPLFTGIAMIAINSARGLPYKISHIFAYFSFILPLGVASLLVSIATDLGMMLFIPIALYVFMATSFTSPLIVDKRLSPFSAIFLSIKMTNAYLFQMTIIFLIIIALFVGVILTFGLALIWVGPYFFNIKAVLYTELFCSSDEADETEVHQTGVFNA